MSELELTPDDFAPFFRAVHGVDPFPWQERLLGSVAAAGIWPDVLDLPTGSGKTAAIDIAVFHLALETFRGLGRQAPVRIAFVVDRRLIVDDAFERARKLARALAEPSDPNVSRVAASLRRLAGNDQPPLLTRRLRGGAPLEDDWARTPVQPTILCSTVDQVGSRLLFRGYGISDRMKPVHAGLLGSDCLLLLDEAHLAEPFRQTVIGIERLRRGDEAPWAAAFLTATPGHKARRPFALGNEDRAHPLLSRRLRAAKRARLINIADNESVEIERLRAQAIAEEAKRTIAALTAAGVSNPAVGVVVNRVARAREVFERLKAEATDTEVILIIGPARSIDREGRSEQLNPVRTRTPDVPRALDRPLLVVATQTIEAGVDIDLDGLVTEVAALDALRQRFGRLNRAGRLVTPFAAILAHKTDIGTKADDPVYGDRAAKTWEELVRRASASTDNSIDFGVEALSAWLAAERINELELAAPTRDAPVLLPAYADLWSHTSPVPNADPEVALFLHGPDRSPASVLIVWRADVTEQEIQEQHEWLMQLFRFVPPRAGEAIEVPLWTARTWLRENYEPLADLADIAERAPELAERRRGRPAFRYRGASDTRSDTVYAGELLPGDLIIVPAEYGGCDEWGWKPSSRETVMDAAERAAWPYRSRRFAVRVYPGLIRQEVSRELVEHKTELAPGFGEVADRLPSTLAAHAEESATRLLEAVLELELPLRLRVWLEALKSRKGRLERLFTYNYDQEERPRGVVFVAPLGLRVAPDPDDPAAAPSTESDELGSTPGYAQTLDEHSTQVGDWAHAFAERAGLPITLAADLALAAYLHDAGKADPRFQAYLAGGDPFGWDEARVLAKSGRSSLPRSAWERAGLPNQWRHEALSVRLARLHPRFADANDPALVLWLVGVHHGYGRPLYPHADPLDAELRELPHALDRAWRLEAGHGPQSLAFEFNGRDWAQMFEDLKRRYGIWGLARLEGFVRLADHRASEAAERWFADREIPQ